MDSIFEEEDSNEMGGKIEAYCPSQRCKADTNHVIVQMYEEEIRRVQCETCGDVHPYRKPRGDGDEEEGTKRAVTTKKLTWMDAMARASEADLANYRPFTIRDAYEEGDVVFHKQFDVGFVTQLLRDNKVEVIFREGDPRILVHNSPQLAA